MDRTQKLRERHDSTTSSPNLPFIAHWGWVADRDVVLVSSQLRKLLNLESSSPELSLQELGDAIYPDDRDAFGDMMSRARQVGMAESEIRFFHADGRVHCGKAIIEFSSRASQAASFAIGTLEDLDGTHQLARLHANDEIINKLLDATLDGYILADDQGQIFDVNPAYCHMVGRTREELLRLNIRDVEGKLSESEIAERIHQIMTYGRARFTTRHRHRDGSLVFLDVSITVINHSDGRRLVAAFVRDITQDVKNQKALREQEEFIRALLDSTEEAIFGVDQDGICTFCNASCVRLLGFSTPAELIGRRIHDLVHVSSAEGDLCSSSECPLRIPHADDPLRCTGQFFRRRDGTVFPISYWSHPMSQPNRHAGAVVTFIDESHRNKLEEQLRLSQKMEAIGRMAGGLAHDFNNLLQAISAYTCLVKARLREDDVLQEDLDQVLAATGRAHNLTQQLLSFSRRQTVKLTDLDVNDSIRSVLRMLKPMLGETISLDIHLHPEPLFVRADSGQLAQVLLNLGINARDAMERDGTLQVKTYLETNPADKVRAESDVTDWVVITVSDTGHGIPSEIQHRIFEPFFTTKDVGKGTGLGLSVVFGIIQKLGGTIDFESHPDQGTTFRIRLPHVETAAATITETKPAKMPGRDTILVAEDDPAVLASTRALLRSFGYDVLTATNGEEACELFRQHHDVVDIVLTDSVMPKMDGLSLYRELQQLQPNIKTILLSGYAPGDLSDVVKQDDNVIFLQKPVFPDDLSAAIRRLLNRPS